MRLRYVINSTLCFDLNMNGVKSWCIKGASTFLSFSSSYRTEAIVWIAVLSLVVLRRNEQVHQPYDGLSTVLLVTSLALELVSPTNNQATPSASHFWRNQSSKQGDFQGSFMSLSLLPALVWSLEGYKSSSPLVWNEEAGTSVLVNAIAIILFLLRDRVTTTIAYIIYKSHFMTRNLSDWTLILQFLGLYLTNDCIALFKPLHGVFTAGEWRILSMGLFIVAIQFITLLSDKDHPQQADFLLVATAGLLGSLLIVAVSSGLLLYKYLPFLQRLVMLVVTPLVIVDVALSQTKAIETNTKVMLPKCAFWLINFLTQSERAQSIPRMVWFLYWILIIALAIIMAPVPDPSSRQSIVQARKWFHLVAVFLFVPVTLAAPELQSLCYAVALAVLISFESVRHEIPSVNTFYTRYLDASKDSTENKVLASHLALIFGCAVPLWLAQVSIGRGHRNFRVLALWGVIVLGVGDAMGAVVGCRCGKTRWGQSGRTIEGSVAMLVSMSLCCAAIPDSLQVSMAACIVTTLLEAFTLQIDNLVLPLAGAAVILALSG